jgi:hypothetical protein
MNPIDGSAGVDSTFVSHDCPLVISTIVTSVNVPPTSMPTLYSAMSVYATLGGARFRGEAHAHPGHAGLRTGYYHGMRTVRSHRSYRSGWSIGSALSLLSLGSVASFGSVLSIGSSGSILSIGSAGSILSIGSAGSILCIGSAGGILRIGKRGRRADTVE